MSYIHDRITKSIFFVVKEIESQLPSCHWKIQQFTVGEQSLGGRSSTSQSELVDRGKPHTGGDPVFLLLCSLINGGYSKLTAY